MPDTEMNNKNLIQNFVLYKYYFFQRKWLIWNWKSENFQNNSRYNKFSTLQQNNIIISELKQKIIKQMNERKRNEIERTRVRGEEGACWSGHRQIRWLVGAFLECFCWIWWILFCLSLFYSVIIIILSLPSITFSSSSTSFLFLFKGES
jgi:hypothetical protein